MITNKNKYLAYFFNKFDYLIRFLYSQLSLNKLFFWKLYSSDFERLDSSFEKVHFFLKSHNFSFQDKTCLELGPGNSYVNAYNFLFNGSNKVVLVDKYPRHIKTKKQKAFFQKEKEFIKTKYNNKEIDFDKIVFISKDLSEVELNEEIDFVYSISVFEHIKNVEENIKKLSSILKKGGFLYHLIDMRDHYNFDNPFLFLKYSKKTWENYLTKKGVSYTNRIRYSEFKEIFEKNGFEIISEQITRYPMPNKIYKAFNKDDKNIDIGIWRVLMMKK
ncbi:hypothetical protein CVU82_01220 [Candidatus Falkowbacteria bacterium HGW-Falkowbacteria-1]|uniref:Methyltransferase type 11 domain-containing protein n=1 Tax=Candidatus Falkowbacteria bacterium HGW-Falkowbacteria-1 TaxID=2013768 RepID=A0A2N2EAR6_9BACT|nr:MAG: hypothetical protein CVU82_01220 [Candidatus Falkowbacteria bacterium HGW-Falkowbacteria-1]